jgi:GxxExxY protein
LQKTVARVYERVPFYRRRTDEKGLKPADLRALEDIRLLPFTTKDDMREGHPFARQVPLPVVYKEVKLDCGCRQDVVVEGKVLLELKTVETLLPIHEAQLLTYLKLSGIRTGLLMNFNVAVLKDGIKRMVN